MPDAHELGAVNKSFGICGFTSTLYAVHANQPKMRSLLNEASGDAETRLMAEIKTFLVLMKAQGKQTVLDEIEELTQSFDNYKGWTVNGL